MNRIRLFVLSCLALGLLLSAPVMAAEPTHDMILLRLDSPAADAFMQSHGHELDIARTKIGQYAEVVVTEETMDLIRQSGLDFEILTKNLEQHYASRSRGIGFGIYHTYSENVAFQDSLRLLYPHVISEKWSIGQTHQGNDIWAFRVSANPDIDEDEPEILFDGMHHAREIMASEFPIMFAEYLAQNYGTDPEITWLLDNRELYVVPIVNPDGVLYNESTNPNGGGMWRKNRRNNGGSYGVDPNRNYPYQWGYDDDGSSPSPSSDTYRGPSAGSEPCVQAMMEFIQSREFITQDSIHTYSNLILYPWGFNNMPTAHEDVFVHIATEMAKFNGYAIGRPGDLLYNVNGGTNDWAYGHAAFGTPLLSFTSEFGGSSDGFWPSEARRGPLFQENIWPHIYLMRTAGPFIAAHSPVVSGASKSIEPGQTGFLDFTVENQSAVASAMDVSVTVHTDDPWIQLGAAQFDLGFLASLEGTTLGENALPVTVDPSCPDGHLAQFTVTVHMAEGDLENELSFMVGSPNIVFTDDLENGTGNFQLQGQWGQTTSQSHSTSHSLTDTPSGEYSDQTSYAAVLDGQYQATELSFWHRYDIETNWDYGRVQVSTNGNSWTTLENYTGTQTSWQQVTLDLSEYSGQDLYFRFMLETDYSVTEDGWYIDDIQIIGAGSDNLAPATPMAISPVDGGTAASPLTLTVSNVTDPEGSTVDYGFRVYSDEFCTDLVASTEGVAESSGQTSWATGNLADGTYWWRAFAGDGEQRSSLSAPSLVTVTNGATGVDDLVISGPSLRVLDQVSGGGARLQLGVPGSTKVAVDVYDMRGARVRQLYSGVMDAGLRILTWDGRDDSGRNTASGMYFLRMQAGAEVLTGRVVVVR